MNCNVKIQLINKFNLCSCLDIVSIFIASYCDDIWNLYYRTEYEGFNGLLYISITGYVFSISIIRKELTLY